MIRAFSRQDAAAHWSAILVVSTQSLGMRGFHNIIKECSNPPQGANAL